MDEAEHCNRIGLMYGGRLVALDTPAGLKRSVIEGAVLEIEGSPQEQARALIASHPGVREVAPHGARLHAIVDDASLRTPQLEAQLRTAGIKGWRVDTIDPSLEDVFVTLVGRQGGYDAN